MLMFKGSFILCQPIHRTLEINMLVFLFYICFKINHLVPPNPWPSATTSSWKNHTNMTTAHNMMVTIIPIFPERMETSLYFSHILLYHMSPYLAIFSTLGLPPRVSSSLHGNLWQTRWYNPSHRKLTTTSTRVLSRCFYWILGFSTTIVTFKMTLNFSWKPLF